MRIDRKHWRWAICTAAIFVASLAGYLIYALKFRNGPMGGSIPGLIFGGAGYGMMLYALLLNLRKTFTTWRIGRTQTWMRGHLWMGFLSYPMILFHGGFTWGSGLTFALMLVLSVVFITGLVAAVLQHYMPRMMTDQLASETIYYQIDRVLGQLREEADKLLISLFRKETQYGLLVPAAEKIHATATTVVALEQQAGNQLHKAYDDTIQPYLAQRGAYRHALNDPRRARSFFADLRKLAPEPVYPVIDGLESICDEKRGIDRQSRMHRFLYSWLLVHVPFSYALILLGGVHAIMALLYA